MHEMQARAARGEAAKESGDDRIERLGYVVVPDPVLEQVAKHVQRVGFCRGFFEEGEKPLVRRRPILTEVKIGDEQRTYFASTTVTDSMTTACRGTSRGKGPPAPVGDLAILVTTSMPDTTLPKTVYPLPSLRASPQLRNALSLT